MPPALGEGLSDSFTVKFKKELANLAFEDKLFFPVISSKGSFILNGELTIISGSNCST